MQLTRFSDLALRALMLLAVAEPGERLTAATLAESAGAPAGHLAKAVSRLVELGLVESRRGRAGGLHITEAGRRASVGAVLREIEPDTEVVTCEGPHPCPLASGCRLRRALAAARAAFFAELDPVTVDALTAAPTRELLLGLGRTTS